MDENILSLGKEKKNQECENETAEKTSNDGLKKIWKKFVQQ